MAAAQAIGPRGKADGAVHQDLCSTASLVSGARCKGPLVSLTRSQIQIKRSTEPHQFYRPAERERQKPAVGGSRRALATFPRSQHIPATYWQLLQPAPAGQRPRAR